MSHDFIIGYICGFAVLPTLAFVWWVVRDITKPGDM